MTPTPEFVEAMKFDSTGKIRFDSKNDFYLIYVLRVDLPPEKIEKYRLMDETYYRMYGNHYFANFLPDDERPADVPAL